MLVKDNVCICGIEKEDIGLIYDWANDPELRSLTGTIYPVSEFEHEKWIENKTTSNNSKLFVIKVDNEKIGTIGLKNFDFINSNVELFIGIGRNQSQGKGYGTKAVDILTDHCFKRLNLHKVYLKVFSTNERAISCYKKCGFSIDGILKDDFYNNGEYHDVYIMSKINI